VIDANLRLRITGFQAAVTAAKPIGQLSPLQLAALVAQGQALVEAIDAALVTIGAPLDAEDPAGHPLTMIAAMRARAVAAQDQAALSDIRGFVARAVLNLSQGFA
jgi:hypothetical protein